jgi:hypothetical protein
VTQDFFLRFFRRIAVAPALLLLLGYHFFLALYLQCIKAVRRTEVFKERDA